MPGLEPGIQPAFGALMAGSSPAMTEARLTVL
jgi:hypothetical protein